MTKENYRIRVTGVLVEGDKVLLLSQKTSNRKYAIPGGGADFNESIEQALIREYKEETGLTIQLNKVLFISEYFKDDTTHVIEIAFLVSKKDSNEKFVVGHEPDSTDHPITDCKMIPINELENIGMNKLALLLKDVSLFGQYAGLRDK